MLAVYPMIVGRVDHRLKLANEVTFKRMKDTMQRLFETSVNELNPLSKILLGISEPTEVVEKQDIEFYDETLNDSQKDAVRMSLSAPEIAIIHGPPGVSVPFLFNLMVDRENTHTYRNNSPDCFVFHPTLTTCLWPL